MPSIKEQSLRAKYEQLAEEIDRKETELIKLNAELLALARAASFREEMEKN